MRVRQIGGLGRSSGDAAADEGQGDQEPLRFGQEMGGYKQKVDAEETGAAVQQQFLLGVVAELGTPFPQKGGKAQARAAQCHAIGDARHAGNDRSKDQGERGEQRESQADALIEGTCAKAQAAGQQNKQGADAEACRA